MWIVALLVVVFLGVGVYLSYSINKRKRDQQKERLEELDRKDVDEKEEVELTNAMKKRIELEVKLVRAGFPMRPKEFNRLRWGLTIGMFLITAFLLKNPVLGVILAVGVFVVPGIALSFAIEKKKSVFEGQIPTALSLIRNSVEAGFSFLQAMEVVATEMEAPISEEFSRVLHEASVGKDLEEALVNMQNRVLSDEIRLVVIAVLIQREVGGNLVQVIDVILATVKDRIQIKGEIRSATAQGRISALIICLIPFILAGVMYMINPEYMSPLFTTIIGQIMIGFAVALIGFGAFLISKIIKIDF